MIMAASMFIITFEQSSKGNLLNYWRHFSPSSLGDSVGRVWWALHTSFEMSTNSCITIRQINYELRTHSRLKNYFWQLQSNAWPPTKNADTIIHGSLSQYFSLLLISISPTSFKFVLVRSARDDFMNYFSPLIFFISSKCLTACGGIVFFFTLPGRALISLSHWGK